jgi:hypothetical protein
MIRYERKSEKGVPYLFNRFLEDVFERETCRKLGLEYTPRDYDKIDSDEEE